MSLNGGTSHAEIWDDSALVNSWNDALEEYKKYHSMKARGENVDEVLTQDATNSAAGTTMDYEGEALSDPLDNDLHPAGALPEETAHNDIKSAEEKVQVKVKHPVPDQPLERSPALPEHLIGQVHDEGLKNLLMSWYYAGYYTGLYEGQQGKTSLHAKHEA